MINLECKLRCTILHLFEIWAPHFLAFLYLYLHSHDVIHQLIMSLAQDLSGFFSSHLLRALFSPFLLFYTILILLVYLRSLIFLAATIAVAPMLIIVIALILIRVGIIPFVIFFSHTLLAHGLLAIPKGASTIALRGLLEAPL
jgi:hypothetical protein